MQASSLNDLIEIILHTRWLKSASIFSAPQRISQELNDLPGGLKPGQENSLEVTLTQGHRMILHSCVPDYPIEILFQYTKSG